MVIVICIAFFYDQTQVFDFRYINVYEVGLSIRDYIIFTIQFFSIAFNHKVNICFVSNCLICTDTDTCFKTFYFFSF